MYRSHIAVYDADKPMMAQPLAAVIILEKDTIQPVLYKLANTT